MRYTGKLILALLVLGGGLVRGEILSNAVYRLQVETGAGGSTLELRDQKLGMVVAEGVSYSAQRMLAEGAMLYRELKAVSVAAKDDVLTIRGKLAGLELEQQFRLPADKPYLEESITLTNGSGEAIRLEELEVGLLRRIASRPGQVLVELRGDRVVALPFRRRPTDTEGQLHDYGLQDFLTRAGEIQRFNPDEVWAEGRDFPGGIPSRHWSSEGWAWSHKDATFCAFKFNQEAMEFSVISTVVGPEGVALRFGGVCMVDGAPSCLSEIPPGRSIRLGLNRYQTVQGNYLPALYALRSFLDEHGCGVPAKYNPQVHWNELYDNPFYTVDTPGKPVGHPDDTRAQLYTSALIEAAAAKARDYGCQALYLDPGWDSNLGTLLWGEKWLGPRRDFIRRIKSEYGLGVSLHCALASWMSDPFYITNNPGVSSFPPSSFRKDSGGKTIDKSICIGSRQYLDLAFARISENCADGVGFVMLDGDWYQGGCWDRDHGHPVPYRKEDQIEAVAGLAQRIHAAHPEVVVEMHDPISGGSSVRCAPLYYKYGVPGCFDEIWGFELMWQPMHDLRTGAARSLFYYNLGCNVPAYLHVDLRGDNEHALVLWWYASTCRHLGIGGTHPNPLIADLQMREMKRYRKWARFFQHGDFYGVDEQIHLHVLPEENAFVAAVFNLSNEPRRLRGDFDLRQAKGLDLNRFYTRSGRWGDFDKNGTFKVRLDMPPWSAQVEEFRALPGAQ
jgi:hypothetical protein